MTGSRYQLYNGLMLLFTFFVARLVYGPYQSWLVFQDIFWASKHATNGTQTLSSTMLFAADGQMAPLWLGGAYLMCNMTLNFLNLYWFVMMIKAVRKRFEPATTEQLSEPKSAATEIEIDISSVASGIAGNPIVNRRKR